MRESRSRCVVASCVWGPIAIAAAALCVGLVQAGACYEPSGWVGCWSQDGPGPCPAINPLNTLPCPGGPWTIADLATMGADVTWPCHVTSYQQSTPRDNAFTGNLSDGYMEVGDVEYDCIKDAVL